jgi:GT2 family glycosyltransferase
LTPDDFFTRAADAFDRAVHARGVFARVFRIGIWRVRICFAGPDLVEPLTRALDHLRLNDTDAGPADLTVLAWTGTEADQSPPEADAANWQMGHNGFIRSLSDERFAAHWMFAAGGLQMLDREGGRALFWLRESADLPYWESGAPLRFLFDAWLQDRGWLLVHGAAVGNGRGAILLVGAGGSGKSSTALACLSPHDDAGVDYLADDYVALNPEEGTVYSVYSSGKVDASSLARMPFLEPYVANAERLGQEKGLVFVHEAFPHKVRLGPLPVRAVVQPVIQPGAGCRPTPPSAILKGLAASTMLQSARPSAAVLTTLARLVSTRPTFEFNVAAGSVPEMSDLAALLPARSALTRRSVTVVVPCYNPGPYLHEALASICAQNGARQPGALDVVVVDDGSDEDISPVLRRFASRLAIRYERQVQQGPSAARNRGIALAQSEYIAFLDQDDLWPAGSLEIREAALTEHADIDVVHGRLRNLRRDEHTGATQFGPPRRSFNVGGMLFRRRVFERTGVLDERLRFSEDVDLLVRITEAGVGCRRIDDVCLYYRRHGSALTGRLQGGEGGRMHLSSWAYILKRSLDRRRT